MTSRMSPAELRIRGHRGVFVADRCEVVGLTVKVCGRWRERTGPNYSRFLWREPRTVSWPLHRVLEIHWLGQNEAAA